MARKNNIKVHKENRSGISPKVSVILLDWSCRERFHALDWLNRQDVPRVEYEIIWVELFKRVVPEIIEKADVVITCEQRGLYHKHKGYNAGLLHSGGEIITICDSDAVFPPDFIRSIIRTFKLQKGTPSAQVLMHYEWRSAKEYPEGLTKFEDLKTYHWVDLWPNVGACMSVLKADAIGFGGFDEHRSFRGYLCGPYDLGWRLVNAGLPEVWHDESTALWHFSHPNPSATYVQIFSIKMWREVAYPHVDYHALSAVDAFSSGRMLPLRENPVIHRIRMKNRIIGTTFEEKYAWMTGPYGFNKWQLFIFHLLLILQTIRKVIWALLKLIERRLGAERYSKIKSFLVPSAKRHSRAIEKTDGDVKIH